VANARLALLWALSLGFEIHIISSLMAHVSKKFGQPFTGIAAVNCSATILYRLVRAYRACWWGSQIGWLSRLVESDWVVKEFYKMRRCRMFWVESIFKRKLYSYFSFSDPSSVVDEAVRWWSSFALNPFCEAGEASFCLWQRLLKHEFNPLWFLEWF